MTKKKTNRFKRGSSGRESENWPQANTASNHLVEGKRGGVGTDLWEKRTQPQANWLNINIQTNSTFY